jgi:hypothetical protein
VGDVVTSADADQASAAVLNEWKGATLARQWMPRPAKELDQEFRYGLYDIVERRHDLGWWLQFANEPANISGFHWIWRYSDLFDVIAFRAVERAKPKSSRPRFKLDAMPPYFCERKLPYII